MAWLQPLADVLGGFLTRIILAAMILLIGFVLGKVVGRIVYHFLHEAELNRILKRARAGISLERSLSKLAEYLVNFVTVIIAINQLGVGGFVLYVLAFGILIIAGISFFLAIKDLIPNFLAGLFIFKRNKIKKGDKVKMGRVEGTVVLMDMFETHIKTKSGEIIQIPNSLLRREVVSVKRK